MQIRRRGYFPALTLTGLSSQGKLVHEDRVVRRRRCSDFALAPPAPLASINQGCHIAFTTREIDSPDPIGRVAEAEAQIRNNLGDIGEKMVLNMGPSHPATHGVLRLVLGKEGAGITKGPAGAARLPP